MGLFLRLLLLAKGQIWFQPHSDISTVLPELTSKQKTGREIKTITSSDLRGRWTKRGGGSDCTICPMVDERDSERSRFHHAGQSKSAQIRVFTAASQMFLIDSNWQS